MPENFVIAPATGPKDIENARKLFAEYADWLDDAFGISLEFQGIAEELAGLPGKYAPPKGQIWLAREDQGRAEACIAMRPFSDIDAERKRLYVRPGGRGAGLGEALVAVMLDGAREAGYKRCVLDTAPGLRAAQCLYERLGFTDIPPYYHNPVPGVRYMAHTL